MKRESFYGYDGKLICTLVDEYADESEAETAPVLHHQEELVIALAKLLQQLKALTASWQGVKR